MASRFPFPAYGNGWFRAIWSSELGPGDVVPLHRFGRDFVLFRDEAGDPHLLDAHCPHLGAHLGHGGRVEGRAIRCPFHAWLWGADGACLEIPYARRIPPGARIRSWPVVERNGIVFFWHHVADEPPSFEIPALPPCSAGGWTPFEVRKYRIRSHWVDMNENAVDFAHFVTVHGTPAAPDLEVEARGPELHCTSRPGSPLQMHSTDVGPGFRMIYTGPPLESLIVLAAVPIDEEYTESCFAYAAPEPSDAAGEAAIRAMVERLDRDMRKDAEIWENKAYRAQPLLCDGDGPIPEYRRWIAQFY